MEAGSCSQLKTYLLNVNILPHNLEDGTLEIPQKFVKEHVSHLWKYVCFEAAKGKLWKVELKTCDGYVWLHKGWKDFIQYYSIRSGYTLLLRYEGGSFFQVTIFDTSGLEIEYPVDSASTYQRVNLGQPKSIKEEEASDDSSIVILDFWPQTSREETVDIQSTNIECNNEVIQVEGVNTSNERSRVVEQAKNFQSTNPHFTVVMPPTCLSHLEIPESPVIGYLYESDWKEKGIFLNGPDGRSLLVKCCIEGPPVCQVRLSEGWKEFAQKYGLREGHACTFELINPTIMLFNVTMDKRDTENEQSTRIEPAELIPGPHGLTVTPIQQRVGRAESLQSTQPSFKVVHKAYNRASYSRYIPYAHASRFLSDQHGKDVFLHGGLAEQTWCAKCYYGYNNARISSGWKKFVADNDLKEGDTCVFELLSQSPNHYKVTILPNAESEQPN